MRCFNLQTFGLGSAGCKNRPAAREEREDMNWSFQEHDHVAIVQATVHLHQKDVGSDQREGNPMTQIYGEDNLVRCLQIPIPEI